MGCPKYDFIPPVSVNTSRTARSLAKAFSEYNIIVPTFTGHSDEIYSIGIKSELPSENVELSYISSRENSAHLSDLADDFSKALYKMIAIKRDLESRLSSLRKLKENWNGYGAAQIESRSAENAQAVIINTPAAVLDKWHLFPSTNGTLMFTAKSGAVGSVSIGNDGFSYALVINGEIHSSPRQIFDVQAITSALSRLSSLF